MCGVHTSTPASALFGGGFVRCRIGTQEKLGIAGGCRGQERQAVGFTFEDREAVEMGFDSSHQECVAVVEEVVGSDTRRHVRRSVRDVFHPLFGGYMFHDDFEIVGHVSYQRFHNRFDEFPLAIVNIDAGCGHLRMDAEDDSTLGHPTNGGVDMFHVRDTELGVGGGTRRIIFARVHVSALLRLGDLLRCGVIGEVQRHERRNRAFRDAQYVLPVHQRHGGVGHRWVEIRHDDAFHELAGGVCDDGGGFGTVAEMMVEIVRFGDGETTGGGHLFYFGCDGARGYVADRSGIGDIRGLCSIHGFLHFLFIRRHHCFSRWIDFVSRLMSNFFL
mmetsp:Transcript_18118/g.22186  ORF Transcript_18118/g.22186 Transcript_18118/m.22186 type:complete len:331 (+) Transcript_18118:533-1525(+)